MYYFGTSRFLRSLKQCLLFIPARTHTKHKWYQIIWDKTLFHKMFDNFFKIFQINLEYYHLSDFSLGISRWKTLLGMELRCTALVSPFLVLMLNLVLDISLLSIRKKRWTFFQCFMKASAVKWYAFNFPFLFKVAFNFFNFFHIKRYSNIKYI